MLHTQFLRPGPVASVGDALVSTRKQLSSSELAIKYTDKAQEKRGANVQDGQSLNPRGKGAGGCVTKKWLKPISHKTPTGWVHQDLRAPDKSYEPAMSQTFGVFENQVATIHQSQRTGMQFLPLPNGYSPKPTDVPRGGLVPRVTELAVGDFGVPTGGPTGQVVTLSMVKGMDKFNRFK